MKKFLAIILISAIAGDSIRIEELMKLPNLILHFAEHKSTHPGETALIFLVKHYIENRNPVSEKDKSSDSTLPFKSPQAIQTHLAFFVFTYHTFQFVLSAVEAHFIGIEEGIIPSSSFDIWQPPKLG